MKRQHKPLCRPTKPLTHYKQKSLKKQPISKPSENQNEIIKHTMTINKNHPKQQHQAPPAPHFHPTPAATSLTSQQQEEKTWEIFCTRQPPTELFGSAVGVSSGDFLLAFVFKWKIQVRFKSTRFTNHLSIWVLMLSCGSCFFYLFPAEVPGLLHVRFLTCRLLRFQKFLV